MTDKHTLALDYQVQQARRVKALTAENNKLRAQLEAVRRADRGRVVCRYLAAEFRWWLRFAAHCGNHPCTDEAAAQLDGDLRLVPPEWPSVEVVRRWIDGLESASAALDAR